MLMNGSKLHLDIKPGNSLHFCFADLGSLTDPLIAGRDTLVIFSG